MSVLLRPSLAIERKIDEMMEETQRVLINGASRAIGPCGVRAFHKAGFFVRIFSTFRSDEGVVRSH